MTTETDLAAMVERMALEVGFFVDPTLGFVYAPFDDYSLNSELERFAALVAGECARICAEMGDGPFAKGWDSDDYAAAIRERFGIEEG